MLRAICGLAPVAAGTDHASWKRIRASCVAAVARHEGVSPARADGVSGSVRIAASAPDGRPDPGRAAGDPRDRDAEPRIEQALDEVGLGIGFRFRYPHQLSGGQRQRIAVARALILEPQILLLDEPTSSLDASVQAEVLNLLEDLRRRRGLTFIMVSHDLAVVTHMCERLMVMNQGHVVDCLTPADLAVQRTQHDYTRKLIDASIGFRRGAPHVSRA